MGDYSLGGLQCYMGPVSRLPTILHELSLRLQITLMYGALVSSKFFYHQPLLVIAIVAGTLVMPQMAVSPA
jgi:hypothetical protein